MDTNTDIPAYNEMANMDGNLFENEDTPLQCDKEDIAMWCAELFPPMFTRDDVLERSEAETDDAKCGLGKDYYSEVYANVVLQEELKKKRKTRTVLQRKNDVESESEDYEESTAVVGKDTPTKQDCLWTDEELQLFRKTFVKLKEKAVRLVCIVETKNLRIAELKKENKSMRKQLKQKDMQLAELGKEKALLQEYATCHEKICADLEKKLQFYEDCNNDFKEILLAKDEQIRKEKSELRKVKVIQEQNEDILEKLNVDHRLELTNKIDELRNDYENKLILLQKEVDRLKNEKGMVDEQCSQYKRSLSELQRHFMDGNVVRPQHKVTRNTKEKKYRGVADLQSSIIKTQDNIGDNYQGSRW